jgi:uncharacterized protein involved in exopolysaccharide biosynthesis/Mrp family chromosome partitioning ATPase
LFGICPQKGRFIVHLRHLSVNGSRRLNCAKFEFAVSLMIVHDRLKFLVSVIPGRTFLKDNSSIQYDPQDGGAWMKKFSAPKAGHAILDVFKRRRRVFSVVTLITFVALAALVLSLTPKSIATTKVKLDPTRDALAAGEQKLRPEAPDQVLVDTEVSVMKSRDVARAVVEKLHLDKKAEFAGALANASASSPGARSVILDEVSDRVLSGLEVEREKGTYIVGLSFTAKKAADAAQIANAFADAYIDQSLVSRTGTAGQQAKFLQKSVADLKRKLEDSDRQFAQYASKAGVMAGRGGGDGFSGTVTDAEVAPLTSQVAEAESDAAAAASKLASARAQVAAGGMDSIANVLDSPVVTSLRQQRAEVARELGDSHSRYGPNHPITIMAKERADRIDQQISDEGRRILASLTSDAASTSARASALRSQLATLRGQQASNTRASVVATSLQLRSDSDREAYNREREQFQQVNQLANNTMSQATIVEPASAKIVKSSPNKPFYLVLGLIVAACVGGGVIATQEALAAGIRMPAELETELGIPFIVSVPKLKGTSPAGTSPADIIIDAPVSPFAEAFRIARSTLLSGSTTGTQPRIISMMSTLPDEGKTTCSLALSRVLAMSGEKVLLVDCDLRQTGLTRAVGGDGRTGLVEILQDGIDVDRAIYPDRAPGLDVISISAPLFTPQDLFGKQGKMEDLLKTLLGRYDRIVMDCPPLLGVADARALADFSDAAILLVKWNSTPAGSIHAALARFEGDLSLVRGAIFTMVDADSEAIGAMYYSRKYTKYYQNA